MFPTITESTIVSQPTWYRMENGPKAENGKNWPKKLENGSWPEMAENIFSAIFGPASPDLGPRAIVNFLGQFFPFSGFWPVLHSIPGGLTRNCRLHLDFLESLGPQELMSDSFGEEVRAIQ